MFFCVNDLFCSLRCLGLTIKTKEIENNAFAKFCRDNKEYYGIFEKGLFKKQPPFRQLATTPLRMSAKLFLFPTSLLTEACKYLRVKFMLLSYRALIKNHEVTVEIVDHLTKTGEWTETKPPGKMFGSIYGDLRFNMF